MNDFNTFPITTSWSKDAVLARAERTLPAFAWHGGDSDAQGSYIWGRSEDRIFIKLWLEEEPAILTVSFRNAWLDAADREDRKRQLIESIMEKWISSIGIVEQPDEEEDTSLLAGAAAARRSMD